MTICNKVDDDWAAPMFRANEKTHLHLSSLQMNWCDEVRASKAAQFPRLELA